MKPLILLNFKTYPEALGKKGIALARKISHVKTKKYQIALAPTFPLLQEVVRLVSVRPVSLPVFAQHCDPVTSGAHTGSISLEELKAIGVQGTLLNHSERKVPLPILKKTVELCRQFRITTVVCASTLAEVKKITLLQPDYIAYEPAELIGGNVSVTKAKPGVIVKAVRASSVSMLCGAGIQGEEDISKAIQLGTKGVLIGHAVMQAKDPIKFLKRLLP